MNPITYQISETANNKVAHDALCLAVQQEENITIKLLSCSDDGTTISMQFAEPLPALQKSTYLDPMIPLHDGSSLEYHSKIQNVVPIGGPRMSNRGVQFICTAGQSEYIDYVILEPLHIKNGLIITDKNIIGDTFDIELIHPLTGGVIWSYTDQEPVKKDGETEVQNDAITEVMLQGLTVRFTYNSTGTEDVKVVIGMRAMQLV